MISAAVQSFKKVLALFTSFWFRILEHIAIIIFKAGICGLQGKQYALICAASINQKALSVQSLSSHISRIFSKLFGNNEGHWAQT